MYDKDRLEIKRRKERLLVQSSDLIPPLVCFFLSPFEKRWEKGSQKRLLASFRLDFGHKFRKISLEPRTGVEEPPYALTQSYQVSRTSA